MNSTQEQYQNDEIDLRELVTSLWANKMLILAITAFFSIGGIAYAFLAPQLWSAKALIVAPLPTQLEQLHLKLDSLVSLMDITNENRNINQDKKNKDNSYTDEYNTFFASFSESKLYTDFIQSFDSFDNKREFLKKNGSNRANISINKGKKGAELATLSFSSDNAQEAGKLLNEYVNFIQTKEVTAKNKLLVNKITNQINVLTLTYQTQEKVTRKRLQNDIIRTQYALRICRAAGIETPVENLNNQTLFAIDLGAKALSEKLNILKEIKDYEFINSVLIDTRMRLNNLKEIRQKEVLFTSYHFLQSPSKPPNRNKPKRFFIVVLATFAGLLIGVVGSLLKASPLFRDDKQ